MKRTQATGKNNPSRHITMTDAELAERDAEEAVWAEKQGSLLAAKPMNDWLSAMAESDTAMTRIEEDIIDALDAATKQRLNQEVLDKHTAKKALRGSKP